MIIALIALKVGLTYRLVPNQLDRPPRQALLGLYLEGAWPKELVAKLPTSVKNVVEAVFPDGPRNAVIYASVGEAGKVNWSAREADGHGWRLVPRHSNGYGFVTDETRKLPISLTLGQNWFSARVGQGFRGLNPETNRTPTRLIGTIPEGAYLYVLDRQANRGNLNGSLDLFPANLVWNAAWPQLYANLGTQIEALVGPVDSGDGVVPPFLLAAPASPGRQTNLVETAIKKLIGQIQPKKLNLELPDQTSSTELVSSHDQVSVGRRTGEFGMISRYSSPQKSDILTSYESPDGGFWLSDSALTIQSFISNKAENSLNFPLACAPLTPVFQAIYFPDRNFPTPTQDQWISAWSGNLKKTIFSLNEAETGLFTLCGYFL